MNPFKRWRQRRTERAAVGYLTGLAAFAAEKQAERAALSHAEADAIWQDKAQRFRERWFGDPHVLEEFLAEQRAEHARLYPTWKGEA